MNNVLVIGGGAAGLTAAVAAAKNGSRVTILEHKDALGKKILSTGGGRCNLTNEIMTSEQFHADPDFIDTVLNNFGKKEALKFFKDIGLFAVSKGPYYYPRSMAAASVRNVLIHAAEALGVEHVYHAHVTDIETVDPSMTKSGKPLFKVRAEVEDRQENYACEALILACGGSASPKSGSDGSGFDIAASLGAKIRKPLPALVPLTAEPRYYKDLSGLRVDAKVTLYVDEEYVANDSGEVQFIDQGISGIPVFNISSAAVRALDAGNDVCVEVDFIPEIGAKALLEEFQKLIDAYEVMEPYSLSVIDMLSSVLHSKAASFLAKKIMPRVKGSKDGRSSAVDLSEKELKALINGIKNYRVPVNGSLGLDRAQVTSGGVILSEIDPKTMQSKNTPGLFFAGEIMDIDGICGGYNLQWAWSTGYIAGEETAFI